MNVLFITSSRIGDAVLSTGLLDHIARKYPQAKVTIVCGPLTASLFEGYPNLRRIIPLKKRTFNRHWFGLLAQVAREQWDIIVDLRNSMIPRVVRAKEKYVFSSAIDQKLHKAEQNAAAMKLDYVPAPKLWFSQKQIRDAAALVPDGGPVLGIGPAANWPGKIWPADRFVEIIKFVTGEILPEARVAVFAAQGEEEIARKVLQAVERDKQIDVIAKANPGTAAAALARCDLYIGNDSGLMHCAAAGGVKTLGLFGPSWPHLYRPWGPHCDYARTPETYDELTAYEGYSPETAPCLMGSLTVEAVKEKIRTLNYSGG